MFTYDPLLTTDKDRVRHALGDVNVADPLIQDETIVARIVVLGGWKQAAAELAQGLAARFSLEPDQMSFTGVGSFSWKSRIDSWMGLAASLTSQVNGTALALSLVSSEAPERDGPVLSEYFVSRY